MPVKVEKNIVEIEGVDRNTREEFFDVMRDRVVEMDSYNGKAYSMLGDSCMLFSAGITTLNGKTSILCDPTICIQNDLLTIDGEDYSDIKDILLRHELIELWYIAKPGYSFMYEIREVPGRFESQTAHRLALREQFRFAKSRGSLEKTKLFQDKQISKLAEEARIPKLEEQQEAYDYVLYRYGGD